MRPTPILALSLAAGLGGLVPVVTPAAADSAAVAPFWTAAPARTASVVAADERRWRPPVQPVRIVRGYQPPAHNWLPGHRGIDLRTEPGQTVRSAGAGRVTFAGDLAGRGVVVVDHGGVRTTYEPVAATVVVGERVMSGESIGEVSTGSGHCGDGTCLHLGLRQGRTYLDPRLALGTAHPRLVPW